MKDCSEGGADIQTVSSQNYKSKSFEIDGQCSTCDEIKSKCFTNIGDLRLRCSRCFSFKWYLCGEGCEYLYDFQKMLQETSMEMENPYIQEVFSKHKYKLSCHKTHVLITKQVKKGDKREEHDFSWESTINITIEISQNEDDVEKKKLENLKILVLLEKKFHIPDVAIYSKNESKIEKSISEELKKSSEINYKELSKVEDVSDELKYGRMHVVVTCLLRSRLISDIADVLSGIKEEYYKDIIFVLIHFKKEDTAPCAHDVMTIDRFRNLECIEYFQQSKLQNIQHVVNEIKQAIQKKKKIK